MQEPKYKVSDLVHFYTGFDWTLKKRTGIVVEVIINPMGAIMYEIYGQETMKFVLKVEEDVHDFEE